MEVIVFTIEEKRKIVEELREAQRYFANRVRTQGASKGPSYQRAQVRLEKAKTMAKKADIPVNETPNGEVSVRTPRVPTEVGLKPNPDGTFTEVRPNDDCRANHGRDEQRVTPKGVAYCRACYKANRQDRMDRKAAENISNPSAEESDTEVLQEA